VIGIGPGAFGRIGAACYQNHPRIEDYRAALDRDRLPVWRGIELSADDLVRRAVMEALARHGRVSKEAVEIGHVIDFGRYFRIELDDLARLEHEGLVAFEDDWIVLTSSNRTHLTRVCEVFDRYLRAQREQASLARLI
jgi:oxygen-independent coproporphyrinogen-3 oxidase